MSRTKRALLLATLLAIVSRSQAYNKATTCNFAVEFDSPDVSLTGHISDLPVGFDWRTAQSTYNLIDVDFINGTNGTLIQFWGDSQSIARLDATIDCQNSAK